MLEAPVYYGDGDDDDEEEEEEGIDVVLLFAVSGLDEDVVF